MRGTIAVTAAVLALAVAAAPPAAATTGCAPSGAHVLAASGGARIYVAGSKLAGCVAGRRTVLGNAPAVRRPGSRRVALYALGPRFAGIDTLTMGVDTLSSQLSIVDLRSGRTVATAAATTPERLPESFVTATALRIDTHGTLAWIGSRSAIGQRIPVYEVHTLTAAGSARLVASGPRIAPHSLTLAGTTLSWSDGGAARNATLVP
jgi:hypothetical protein